MSFQILTWKHALNFHFYETESQIETHFKKNRVKDFKTNEF